VPDLQDKPTDGSGWVQWLPEIIRGRLQGRLNLQRILENTGWLVFDRIFRMVIGLIVGIWIARHFGPDLFGEFNYAISFTAIFGSLASLGLDNIVVRELVSEKEKRNQYMGTSFVLRILSGLAVFILAGAAAYAAPKHDSLTIILIIWTALGYIFQATDVIDYWFQANVRSKYVVISKNISFLLVSVGKVVALIAGAPIVVFAILATFEIFLGGISLFIAYKMDGEKFREWRFSGVLCWKMLHDGWPLTLSGIVIVIYMRIDQVLLGNMLDSKAVGIYSAGIRLVEMWYFIPGAVIVSILPTIVKARQDNYELYKKRLQQLYDLMSLISIGIAIPISIFAKQIIALMYGPEYSGASSVLIIYIWSGVGTFLGVASSQYLIAENLTRISLYRTTIGMALNVIINLVLIPYLGIIGSALATLISYTIATFSISFFKSGRDQSVMMLKSLVLTRSVRNLLSH
jgi:polysaccharide transporter, PST family